MKTIFISGTSRGIGLELARQYLEDGWRVLATQRHAGEARRTDAEIAANIVSTQS